MIIMILNMPTLFPMLHAVAKIFAEAAFAKNAIENGAVIIKATSKTMQVMRNPRFLCPSKMMFVLPQFGHVVL